MIRKVGATLRHSVFQLFLDLLSAGGLLDMAKVNRSDFQISLANGSHFIFKGLDDPEKIKSITGITDIVIEEATELSEEDFLQLNLRLRPAQDDPQIYLMFNPVSRANWVYRYFFEQPPPARALCAPPTATTAFSPTPTGRSWRRCKSAIPPITAYTRWGSSPRWTSWCTPA